MTFVTWIFTSIERKKRLAQGQYVFLLLEGHAVSDKGAMFCFLNRWLRFPSSSDVTLNSDVHPKISLLIFIYLFIYEFIYFK